MVPGGKFNFPAFMEQVYYAAKIEISGATPKYPCEDVFSSLIKDGTTTFSFSLVKLEDVPYERCTISYFSDLYNSPEIPSSSLQIHCNTNCTKLS